MSSQSYQHSASWRGGAAGKSTHRNLKRWFFTLLAAALIAWMLWFFLHPRSDQRTHVYFVHPGAYKLSSVTPLMYHAGVLPHLRNTWGDDLQVTDFDRGLRELVEKEDQLRQDLADPDDAVVMIVRGYVVPGPDGTAMLADSDLPGLGDPLEIGSETTPSKPANFSPPDAKQGLIPIRQLLQSISGTPDDSTSAATRFLILDPEPLAAYRSVEAADTALADLLAQIKSLPATAAPLWVLVTRGANQSPGWDPVRRLPNTSLVLAQAFMHPADSDGDEKLSVGEVARFVIAALRETGRDNLQPMLLRANMGPVDDTNQGWQQADQAWLRHLPPLPPDNDDDKDADANGDADAEKDGDADKDSDDKDGDADTDGESGSAAENQDNSDDAAPAAGNESTADEDSGASESINSIDGSGASGGSAPVRKPPAETDSLWVIRDRYESFRGMMSGSAWQSPDALVPSAISPVTWRAIVRQALHAELATDPSDGNADSTDDFRRLSRLSAASLQPGMAAEFGNQRIQELVQNWQAVVQRRRGERIDRRVAQADRLQHRLAVGESVLESVIAYNDQRILIGESSITGGGNLPAQLRRGYTLLDNKAETDQLVAAADAIERAVGDIRGEVDALLGQLDTESNRVNDRNAWQTIARMNALLRSPLPNAKQRRQLSQWLREIQTPPTLINTQAIADAAASAGNPDSRSQSAIAPTYRQRLGGGRLAEVRNRHAIVALPVVRQPEYRLAARGGGQLQNSRFVMKQADASVEFRLNPALSDPCVVELSCVDDAAPTADVRFEWAVSDSGRFEPLSQTRRIELASGKTGLVTMKMITQKLSAGASPIPLTFNVRVRQESTSSVEKRLFLSVQPPRPREIRLLVHAKGMSHKETLGGGQFPGRLSGGDSLGDGIWLFTFAGRQTEFQLSLVSTDGGADQVRAWLVKLPKPTFGQKELLDLPQEPEAVHPLVYAGRIDALHSNLFESDGQVRRFRDGRLRGADVIKGPIDLKLPGGMQPSPLNWKKPDPAPESGAAAPASPPPPPGGAGETSGDEAGGGGMEIDHGLALVLRPLRQSGPDSANLRPDPTRGDQVIWMMPRPRQPETYLEPILRYDLDRSDSSNPEIKVSVRSIDDIDNYFGKDQLPQTDRQPLPIVSWSESPAWAIHDFSKQWYESDSGPKSFEPASIPPGGVVGSEPLLIKVGPREISVPVRSGQGRVPVRLNVDGWPRGITRFVEPKDGERGRKIGRFAPTARFASLTMTYAAAPKGPNMAVQWEKENRLIHPKKVVLVGEGLNLRTELALDVPATDFQTDVPNAKPPYFIVGWLDPNDNRNTLKDSSVYLSDRQYRASLVRARDDGRITIESKVEDLSRDWQSLAIR
ncbi:MAG: hypothetical protein AAF958_10010, partial [Planctomycetota bacterium]